ncbi:MAG TPA: FkbM family methyltransferase [Hyphomicrobiaceae bacterium]|nr:FkbM family methyltransferase [Hyphomicrobiaceae bacterium]
MLLSYAQNLEDYVLEQVFRDVDQGAYVDVGGGHPVADNVSFWFYLKGWRGLVVEPQEKLANAYAAIRPRDAVIAHLAGRTSGEIDFHVVEGLHGLSSANIENAASAKQYGAAYRTIRRRVRPLSDLIDDANLGAIRFLKIDVEGAEADVIAGLDLSRHRPEVILVEAVNPNAKDDHWKPWDATLRQGGYEFVFFDNLNRYYVAGEKRELAGRFPKAPLPWDAAAHLWDCGRAAERPDHPDRALADALVAGLMANLTRLPPDVLTELLASGLEASARNAGSGAAGLAGTAEWPRRDAAAQPADLGAFLTSDRGRAALGRIACMYDGGHLLE